MSIELRTLHGMWVGALDDYERALFYQACEDGLAQPVWTGFGGLLGLARVKVLDGRWRTTNVECPAPNPERVEPRSMED